MSQRRFPHFWSAAGQRCALAGLTATLGGFQPLQAFPPHPGAPAWSVQAPAGLHGTLRIDADSRAASLAFPLGPGLGEADLRYLPTLTGAMAPLVGMVPLASDFGKGMLVPALLATSGFSLAPGLLDWRWPVQEGASPAGQEALVTWTYPDGSRGCLQGLSGDGRDPRELLERFGYDATSACLLPVALNPGSPGPSLLPGTDGTLLLGLADSPRAAEATEAELPAGLLVIRGALAYEYRAEAADAAPGRTRFRLAAIRNAAGQAVTFTYGVNGVDYQASWADQAVRVTLDGMAGGVQIPDLDDALPAEEPDAPSLAFRQALVRVRIVYEGLGAPQSYAVIAAVRPECRTPSGTFACGFPGAQRGWQAGQESLLSNLQVTSIRREGVGDYFRFGYGKATPILHAGPAGGHAFAPTVLREIGVRDHTLRLTWTAQPATAASGTAGAPVWAYAVSAIEDFGSRAPDGSDPGAPGRAGQKPEPAFQVGDQGLVLRLVAVPGAAPCPAAGGSGDWAVRKRRFDGGLKGGCPGPEDGPPPTSEGPGSSDGTWRMGNAWDPQRAEVTTGIGRGPMPPQGTGGGGLPTNGPYVAIPGAPRFIEGHEVGRWRLQRVLPPALGRPAGQRVEPAKYGNGGTGGQAPAGGHGRCSAHRRSAGQHADHAPNA